MQAKLTFITFLLFVSSLTFAFDFRSLLGEPKYNVFGCKDEDTNSPKDCSSRYLIAVATFKVNKEKSEVFISYTSLDSKKALMELDDCKVFDNTNWICGGKETNTIEGGVRSYMKTYRFQMVDGQVTMSDFYSSLGQVGYPPIVRYTKGNTFFKK